MFYSSCTQVTSRSRLNRCFRPQGELFHFILFDPSVASGPGFYLSMELTSVAVVSNTTPEVVSDGANIQHQQHSASTAQDTDVQSEVDLEEGRSGSSVSTAGPRALEWSIEKMEVNAKGGKKKLLLQDIGMGALAWNLDSLMDVYMRRGWGDAEAHCVMCVVHDSGKDRERGLHGHHGSLR